MASSTNSSATKPGWSKPATILFASEIPTNEKAFAFALAQAREFNAHLILLHAYDTLVVAASETSGIRYYDYTAASRTDKKALEPLAERARAAGVNCEVIVRPGLPADQILFFLSERAIDRVVMSTHSPGAFGKLLVGSVAEAVIRKASVPVFVVGPDAAPGESRNFATRTILCAVSLQEASKPIVEFAVDLARQHGAKLVLQHVIRPPFWPQLLEDRSTAQIEQDLLSLVPAELRGKLEVQPIVVPGDAAEELLYQGQAQQAELLVLGAQSASAFAVITRQGVVYKVLAHARCPVITLSPVLLERSGALTHARSMAETFLAGVF